MMNRWHTIPVTEFRVAEAENLNESTGFGNLELADDFLNKMRADLAEKRYVLIAIVDA